MNRPHVIWTVLGLCALLIVGAMAWSTNKVLDLEAKQAIAESAAELEERVRLSLSRIDTAASGLMVLENQRPPHHFKAFYEPEDIFTNKFQVVGKGIVVRPSPLLPELPDFVRLHFEIDAATRQIRSPQVPIGNERDSAEQAGLSQDYLKKAGDRLTELERLLAEPGAGDQAGLTKLDVICTTCITVNDAFVNNALNWNTPAPDSIEKKEASVRQVRGDGRSQLTNQQQFQEDLAIIEKSKRADLYRENSQRAVPRRAFSKPLKNGAQTGVAPQDAKEEAGSGPPAPDERMQLGEESRITPFQPIWLGEELMAVREVVDGEKIRYQGVWFEAEGLGGYLLSACQDLLPEAELERIREISATSLPGAMELRLDELSNDPLSLVTLPWRLQAGEEPVAAVVGWSPLRISLLVGWVALLLALLASAVLVRGVMKLSDRRATFVSSVTHELRTPLTTFHLYSDMLAEGMVQDEDKKRDYLATMRREAERLNHLVENVLAYSRVERGSARARREKVSLGGLLERMKPRLEERARKDEAVLEVETGDEEGRVEIDTDLTAVEQIVFNLVDNACKYGLPDDGARVVNLRASNGGRTARLEVCDRGGGIARADVKKLFRPFHKSARDAAHSKPGVGLGLALCRRLARELGGDLSIERQPEGRGACFVLELPVRPRG